MATILGIYRFINDMEFLKGDNMYDKGYCLKCGNYCHDLKEDGKCRLCSYINAYVVDEIIPELTEEEERDNFIRYGFTEEI